MSSLVISLPKHSINCQISAPTFDVCGADRQKYNDRSMGRSERFYPHCFRYCNTLQKYNIFWSKSEMSDLYIIFGLKFLSWRTSASCGLKVEPDLEGGLVLSRTRAGLVSLSLIEKTFDRVLWQFHLSCDHPNDVAWKVELRWKHLC